jgi:hypothetical protein
VSTADAVAREAAWLQASGDGLPALLKTAGGPWDNVQAYWPRTPVTRQMSVYVLRTVLPDLRVSNQRIRPRYEMTLRLVWPVSTSAVPLLETAQANLDAAADLLIQRIRGPLGDKSHGGRFLSAGENPRRVEARWEDPDMTMSQATTLKAAIAYSIDDYEISG